MRKHNHKLVLGEVKRHKDYTDKDTIIKMIGAIVGAILLSIIIFYIILMIGFWLG